MNRGLVALLLAAGAVPAAACDLAQWQPHVAEASRTYAIPERWIFAVLRAESAGCTHLDGRPITSHAGAMGLMQLMPATWAELRARHGFGTDPFDPRENILAGAAYLHELHERFGVPGAFAAYHAGPGRYEAHLLRGARLPAETHRYLAQVTADASVEHIAGQATAAPADPLFAVVRRSGVAAGELRATSTDTRLFIPLQHARFASAGDVDPPPEQTDAEP